MAANPIPEAAVDALYDELFRVGRYLHAPVPIDPKGIIRRHLAAAQQQEQAAAVDGADAQAAEIEALRAERDLFRDETIELVRQNGEWQARADRLAEALREAADMLLADYPETARRLRAACCPTAAQENDDA